MRTTETSSHTYSVEEDQVLRIDKVHKALRDRDREALLGFFENYDISHIEYIRTKFEKTSNPIYVWELIQFILSPAQDRYFLFDPEADIHFEEQADIYKQQVVGDQKFFYEVINSLPKYKLLPDWCCEYLYKCSHAVVDLDQQVRMAPSSFSDSTPKKAAEALPNAFGFVSKGKNFFTQSFNEVRDMKIYFECWFLFCGGLSKTRAFRAVAGKHGINDERSIQRIVARVLKRSPDLQQRL